MFPLNIHFAVAKLFVPKMADYQGRPGGRQLRRSAAHDLILAKLRGFSGISVAQGHSK